jgi:hypothetical protein
MKKLAVLLIGALVTVFMLGSAQALTYCKERFFDPASEMRFQISELEQRQRDNIRAANARRISMRESRSRNNAIDRQIDRLVQKRERLFRENDECEQAYKERCGYGTVLEPDACELLFKRMYRMRF